MQAIDYEALSNERNELRVAVDNALAKGQSEIDGCPLHILASQVEHMTSLLLCMSARAACEESRRRSQAQQQAHQYASGKL